MTKIKVLHGCHLHIDIDAEHYNKIKKELDNLNPTEIDIETWKDENTTRIYCDTVDKTELFNVVVGLHKLELDTFINEKAAMFKGKLYQSHAFATCSVQDVREYLENNSILDYPKLSKMTDDELDLFIDRCSVKFVIHNADYGIDYNELERLAESL